MEEQVYSNGNIIILSDLGSVVYSEGDTPNGVYLIKEGRVEIKIKNPLKSKLKIQEKIRNKKIDNNYWELKNLNNLRLFSIGENEIFGLEETVENSKRKTTAIWSSGDFSTLFFIPKKDFLILFKAQKNIAYLNKAGQFLILMDWI